MFQPTMEHAQGWGYHALKSKVELRYITLLHVAHSYCYDYHFSVKERPVD